MTAICASARPFGVIMEPGRPIYRRMEVICSRRLTPNMQRIVLGGPEAAGFHFYGRSFGPYVKLILPLVEGGELPEGDAFRRMEDVRNHFALRTYTARDFDPQRQELTIDFVLHGDTGIASRWAARAKPGDLIGLRECGFMQPFGVDWHLFAGDHTALPAVAQSLAMLPEDSVGHALVTIPDIADRQMLKHPKGIVVTWLIGHAGEGDLFNAVRRLKPPPGARIFFWAGAEAQTARALRIYARRVLGLTSDQHFILNYWRQGLREDQ